MWIGYWNVLFSLVLKHCQFLDQFDYLKIWKMSPGVAVKTYDSVK